MWSKIKNIKLPISIKLTVLYTAILFCILLLTSLLIAGGLRYAFYAQAKKDLEISARNAVDYLAAGNPAEQLLFADNILIQDVMLRLVDGNGNLILSSVFGEHGEDILTGKYGEGQKYERLGKYGENGRKDRYEKERKDGKNRKYEKNEKEEHFLAMILLQGEEFHLIRDGHAYFYSITRMARQGDNVYQMQLFQPVTGQVKFMVKLTGILIVTNFIGLLFAIVSGVFISRRILRPIRDITTTAQQIEVNDLDKRIPLSDSNDELGELAKTFNNMLDRIQTGIEQQRRFVSNASHELRTPITVIGGYADMLDRWGKEDMAVLNEGIEAIKSETANMHGLIEKLLFLARTDQHKQIVNKLRLDMQSLIEELVQETSLIAPNHQIILEQNDPAAACVDPSLFKQMLRIFIENSIKYTPKGGKITISSRRIDECGHLEVSIEDNGIGIPEEEQAKIFDRFYRVEKSRSKDTGGTGLGLSIAKWIAKQHNTSMQLTSTPGKGTKITLKTDFIE